MTKKIHRQLAGLMQQIFNYNMGDQCQYCWHCSFAMSFLYASMKAGCLSIKMMHLGKEPVHIFHQQICSVIKTVSWQVTGKHSGATHAHDNTYSLQQDACALLTNP